MKLIDKVKQVNQKTGRVTSTNRAFIIEASLIEMHLLGLITQAQEDSIGGKMDKLLAKELAQVPEKDTA